MRRICHVVQSYYLRDPRVRREAEALSAAGFEVDVICLRDAAKSARETVNGVHITRLPLARRRGSIARYLFEYIAFFIAVSIILTARLYKRYDLIHVSNMPDFLVFAALLPKLFGARVLLDVHDPMSELFMSKYSMQSNHLAIRFLGWQERISLKFSDHVLTVTEVMKERLAEDQTGRPISVVLNLPDNSIFKRPDDVDPESEEHEGFVLLYTGTVGARYGLGIAIRALPALRKEAPDLRLILVGEGDDLPNLKQLAKELDVEDAVEFRSPVPLAEIPRLVRRCDLGISPHIDDVFMRLYFSTKVAEFATMGLPCVVTRTETITRYFDEETVRFCESNDPDSFAQAVLELYRDTELRARMARKCLEFGEKHNWASEKEVYVELVRRILGDDTAAARSSG